MPRRGSSWATSCSSWCSRRIRVIPGATHSALVHGRASPLPTIARQCERAAATAPRRRQGGTSCAGSARVLLSRIACLALGATAAVGARRLPEQDDPRPDPLRARRPDRRGGAPLRRAPAQIARPERAGREQARRLRHHRHRGNGARQARRLHHHGRQHLDQLPDPGAARQAHAHRLRPRRADHRADSPTRRCSSSPPRRTSRRRHSRSSSPTPRRIRATCATPRPASAPISTSTPKSWPSAPAGSTSSTSRSRTAARASSRTSPAATPRCRGSTSPTRSA